MDHSFNLDIASICPWGSIEFCCVSVSGEKNYLNGMKLSLPDVQFQVGSMVNLIPTGCSAWKCQKRKCELVAPDWPWAECGLLHHLQCWNSTENVDSRPKEREFLRNVYNISEWKQGCRKFAKVIFQTLVKYIHYVDETIWSTMSNSNINTLPCIWPMIIDINQV